MRIDEAILAFVQQYQCSSYISATLTPEKRYAALFFDIPYSQFDRILHFDYYEAVDGVVVSSMHESTHCDA